MSKQPGGTFLITSTSMCTSPLKPSLLQSLLVNNLILHAKTTASYDRLVLVKVCCSLLYVAVSVIWRLRQRMLELLFRLPLTALVLQPLTACLSCASNGVT